MAESSDNKKNMRDFLRIVFRNRLRFLLGSTVMAIGVLLLAYCQWPFPLKYTGMTKFQRRTDVAAKDGRGGGTTESFDNIKLTLQQDLKGRDAVGLAAEELKFFQGLPRDTDGKLTRDGQMAKQNIVAKLHGQIHVSWDVKTKEVDLVSISVTHEDRTLAAKLPNLLVTNYINKISAQIVDRLTASRAFLTKKVDESDARLKALEKKRLDFQALHAAAMPGDPGALHERIRGLEGEIERLEISKNTAAAKLEKLRGFLSKATSKPAGVPETAPAPTTMTVKRPNPEWKRLDDQLRNMNEVLESQRIGKTEKHPTIIALQSEIKLLTKRMSTVAEEIDVEITVDPVASRQAVANNTMALEAQIAAVEVELKIAADEQGRLEKGLEPLLALRKNFVVLRQDYTWIIDEITKERSELDTWQKRYTIVQTDLSAEVAKRRTHLSAVQTAEEQEKPSSPSLMIVLGMALIGGLGVGAVLVFLSTVVSRTVNTVEDAVQRFRVPVHGIISEIVSKRGRTIRGFKRWLVVPTVTTMMLMALTVSLLMVVLLLQFPDKHKTWVDTPYKEYPAKLYDDVKSTLPGLE